MITSKLAADIINNNYDREKLNTIKSYFSKTKARTTLHMQKGIDGLSLNIDSDMVDVLFKAMSKKLGYEAMKLTLQTKQQLKSKNR